MKKIRTFIAIEIPSPIQKKIENLQQALKRLGGGGSWVKAGNIHITLKFLGDVDAERIDEIAAAVQKAGTLFSEFPLSIKGTGFFPNSKRPRVLWVGCEDQTGNLFKLQEAIETNLDGLGFARENRKFSAHLTIARIKNPWGNDELVRETLATSFEGGAFQADEIIVMQSELHSTGSVYSPLKKIRLQAH